MMTKTERTKLKARRNEGTLAQWDALTQLNRGEFVYVADADGNWNGTQRMNRLQKMVYQMRQADEQYPLLKTWHSNYYWDSEGCVNEGVNSNSRPHLRTEFKREMPYLGYLHTLVNRLKVLKELSWDIKDKGMVVFTSALNNPNKNKDIRIFDIPLEMQAAINEKCVSHSIGKLPNGEEVKYKRSYFGYSQTNYRLPNHNDKMLITADTMKAFDAWYAENIGFITRCLKKSQAEQTRKIVKSKAELMRDRIRRHHEATTEYYNDHHELHDKVAEHRKKIEKGVSVAQALINFYDVEHSLVDLVRDWRNDRYRKTNLIEDYSIANKIREYSYKLEQACPSIKFEQRRQEILQLSKEMLGMQSYIIEHAPIGGEALIAEQFNTFNETRNTNIKTVEQYIQFCPSPVISNIYVREEEE
tara:strand:+ start:89 stop:1333 length:1245 start_codon:yes stop_codon:yes gene_type:complete